MESDFLKSHLSFVITVLFNEFVTYNSIEWLQFLSSASVLVLGFSGIFTVDTDRMTKVKQKKFITFAWIVTLVYYIRVTVLMS